MRVHTILFKQKYFYKKARVKNKLTQSSHEISITLFICFLLLEKQVIKPYIIECTTCLLIRRRNLQLVKQERHDEDSKILD